VLSLLLSLLLIAGDPHLHGVVRDAVDQRALQGATVRVLGTRLGAITETDGRFHLHDVRGDSVTLEISMVGYAPQQLRVAVGGETELTVDLLAADVQAPTVTVIDRAMATGVMPSQPRTVISMDELDATRGGTFAATLERVPGVTLMTTGPSVSKPMIHGMSGQRLVLTQAGIAQEGQQWGEEHAPEIDPFTPARITVLKGPSGVRLGPNAMGGAISVDPEPLSTESASTRGEASINAFSNNWQGAAGGWVESTRLFDQDVSVRVQGSARKAGDARTPDYVLGNTAFDGWSLGSTLAFGTETLGATVYGSLFSTDLGVYSGAHLGNAADLERAIARGEPAQTYEFSYDIANPRQEVDHTLLSVRGHAALAKDGILRLVYGWQQNDRSEFDKHNVRIVGRGDDPVERARDSIARLEAALAAPAMNLLLTTYNLETSYDHRIGEALTGAAGLSGLRQVNDRSGSVYLVPDYTAHGVGGWWYESLVFDAWSLSGGVRYDHRWLAADVRYRGDTASVQQQKTFSGVSGSVGVAINASADLSVQANVGTAWRPPTVNELYSNDVHHGVARFEIGDSTLAPERSVGGDLTLSWAVQGFEAEISGYANWFDGYIFSVPDPDNPTITVRGTFPTYRFVQRQAMIGGLDVSLGAELTDVVHLYAKGALVRGTDQTTSEPLFMMPADRLRLGLHLHLHDVLMLHETYIDASVLGVREQDRYVPGQDYVPPPPGYVLVDLSVGGMVHIGDRLARVGLSVRNLFDAAYRDYLSRYRYFADDPGRDIVLRFTIPFGASP